MLVDADNRVHFFGCATDTTIGSYENGIANAILEVYQTATGWDAKFLSRNLNMKTRLNYGGLNQMGCNIQASISPGGQLMSVIWLDAGTTAATDTLPDIWSTQRWITSNTWSTPVNISQSPNQAELLVHAAPVLKRSLSGVHTLFLSRCYQSGIATYPPSSEERTVCYVSSYASPIEDIAGSSVSPTTFNLSQNYPNPFNPTTTIRYQLPTATRVMLKVYDVLGREVRTLVDEVQDLGLRSVEFNANELASGVHFYRLTAGKFSRTRRLIVLR
jgi:hypothetical protein